jgi:hypothetical protein
MFWRRDHARSQWNFPANGHIYSVYPSDVFPVAGVYGFAYRRYGNQIPWTHLQPFQHGAPEAGFICVQGEFDMAESEHRHPSLCVMYYKGWIWGIQYAFAIGKRELKYGMFFCIPGRY